MSKNVNITIDADSSQAKKALDEVGGSLDSLSAKMKGWKRVADETNQTADGATSHFQEWQKNVDKASESTQKFNSVSGKTVAIGAALGTIIGNVVSKAFGMMASQMDAAIKRLDTLNNFPRVMANMKVSSADAEKSIAVLQQKLQGLPTSLDDAALSVQRFTAANGNIKASTAMFLSLNDAILAGGASAQLQASALEQMSQAYTKGKADTMEWRTMLQAMPAQMNQIAKAMGYTSAALGGDLYNAMQSGKVSMNEFMATIVRLDKQGVDGFASFSEQAKASTNGVGTSITNLKLTIQRGLAEIMNAIGQSNIAAFFNGIASAIGTVTNYVVAFVKVLAAAINAIRSLFGQGAKGGKATSNAVADAGVSAGNLAASAGDAGSALGDANKQAKQLKKTLASFDEMTVIQEPQQASGGGGGASGGGGGGNMDLGNLDFGDLWGELDGGANKAQEIADKIIGAFQNAFDVISKTKAFDALKKNVQKVGSAISNNLGKAWKSVSSIADTAFTSMGNSLQKFAPEFDNAFAKLFDGLGAKWESLINMWSAPMTNFLNGFANQFAVVGQSITDNMSSSLIAVLEHIGNMELMMASLRDTITESFGPGFETLGTLMANVMNDWFATTAEWLPQIYANFEGFFNELNEGLFKPMTEVLGTIWQGLCKTLSDWWNDYGKRILGGIADWFNGVLSVFRKLWTDILEPVVKPFLEEFSKVWENAIQPALKAVGDFVGKLILFCMEIDQKFIRPIVNFLIDVLKPAFITVFSAIGGVINTVFTTIGNLVKNIMNVFSGLIDFITGVFSGNWKKAWEGVKSIFSNIASALGNIFKAPINFIIDVINGFIDGLNHIKIPDWVPGVGGFGINISKIPKLAKGGIIDGATMALVGESGREAVLPLENNTGWIAELAEQITTQGGTAPTQIIVKLGEETILDKIIDGVNEKSMLSGRNAIAV